MSQLAPAEVLLNERIATIQRVVALVRDHAAHLRDDALGCDAPGFSAKTLALAARYESDSDILVALMRELSEAS